MAHREEHRHQPRQDAPHGVSLTLRPETGDHDTLHLPCRDLSRTGLGVSFPYPIHPDTDVELWIQLPGTGGGPLHLYGTVAWCAAPLGQWRAGIALDLERADGAAWRSRFPPDPP